MGTDQILKRPLPFQLLLVLPAPGTICRPSFPPARVSPRGSGPRVASRRDCQERPRRRPSSTRGGRSRGRAPGPPAARPAPPLHTRHGRRRRARRGAGQPRRRRRERARGGHTSPAGRRRPRPAPGAARGQRRAAPRNGKLRGRGGAGAVEGSGKGKRRCPLAAAAFGQAGGAAPGRGVGCAAEPPAGRARSPPAEAAAAPLSARGAGPARRRPLTFTGRAALASALELPPPPPWACPGALREAPLRPGSAAQPRRCCCRRRLGRCHLVLAAAREEPRLSPLDRPGLRLIFPGRDPTRPRPPPPPPPPPPASALPAAA